MEFNDSAIEIMLGIKKVFDPNVILNPGSFLSIYDQINEGKKWN
jgi:FAD/FMN-containing dehydrogenase